LRDNFEAMRVKAVAMNELRDGDVAFAVRVGSRLKRWKTKPILWRRNLVRAASLKDVKSLPSTRTFPRDACASPPMT